MSIYRLPPRFYYDHVSRELPAGKVIRRTKQYLLVELAPDEVEEMLSDAYFYMDSYGPGAEDTGLRSSARATVRAILPHRPSGLS